MASHTHSHICLTTLHNISYYYSNTYLWRTSVTNS